MTDPAFAGYKGDLDPKALARHLELIKPYLPNRVTQRKPGTYPELDAGGAPAEALAEVMFERGRLGEGVWEQFGAAILDAAQEVVGPAVSAFHTRTAKAGAAAMGAVGPWEVRSNQIMDVLTGFGNHVGRDAANESWQLGYAAALARHMLASSRGSLGAPPPVGEDIVALARRLIALQPENWIDWVDWGLESPIHAGVVLEAIAFVTDEVFKKLYPLYGDELELDARKDLRELALMGFGLGRLHVEPEFRSWVGAGMHRGFAEPNRTPTPAPLSALAGPRVPAAPPDPVARQQATLEEIVPADVRAAIASAGGAFALDPSGRIVSIAIGGIAVAEVSASPPRLIWSDPSFGGFARSLIYFNEMALMLQQNRGRDTFQLRGELRDRLGVETLLAAATAARCTVEKHGGLTTKDYLFSHPAFGQFAKVTVLRGQSHVVDVAFSSPTAFVPLRLLVGMDERLNPS